MYEICKILLIKGIHCSQVCKFVKTVVIDIEYHTINFNDIDHQHDTRNAMNLYYRAFNNKFGEKNVFNVFTPYRYIFNLLNFDN